MKAKLLYRLAAVISPGNVSAPADYPTVFFSVQAQTPVFNARFRVHPSQLTSLAPNRPGGFVIRSSMTPDFTPASGVALRGSEYSRDRKITINSLDGIETASIRSAVIARAHEALAGWSEQVHPDFTPETWAAVRTSIWGATSQYYVHVDAAWQDLPEYDLESERPLSPRFDNLEDCIDLSMSGNLGTLFWV